MNKELKNEISPLLTVGLLSVKTTNISDEDYETYHEQAEHISFLVYKNDKNLDAAIVRLLKDLSLEGLWRGRAFAYCKILTFYLTTEKEVQ